MSENMIQDGYKRIMNIDISGVAVDIMKERCKDKRGLECILFPFHF